MKRERSYRRHHPKRYQHPEHQSPNNCVWEGSAMTWTTMFLFRETPEQPTVLRAHRNRLVAA
jgi:hypothetical protein